MTKYTNSATTNTKKHPGTGHTCGECIRGTWSAKHTNHTPTGRPFLKECEHSSNARIASGVATYHPRTCAGRWGE